MFVFDVGKTRLQIRMEETLVAGTRNSCLCTFHFSPDWDGLDRTAVFYTQKTRRSCILDQSNTCTIPWEVLEQPALDLLAGVYGTRNGEQILATVPESLGPVCPGAIPGEASQEPTPDAYGQMLAAANQAAESAARIQEQADSGRFNGSDGLTPHIGSNGNWWLGDQDTGVPAAATIEGLPELEARLGQAVADETTRARQAEQANALAAQSAGQDASAAQTTADQARGVADAAAATAAEVRQELNGLAAQLEGKASAADLHKAADRIALLEKDAHVHRNQAELDQIQPGDRDRWNRTLEDAKTWVAQQGFLTEADRAAIVQEVIDALGTPIFGTVDSGKNITLSGALEAGVYTVCYEGDDGTRSEVGTITVQAQSDVAFYMIAGLLSSADGSLSATVPGADVAAYSNPIPVESGKTYRLHTYGGWTLNLKYAYYDASGAFLSCSAYVYQGTSVETDFTIPAIQNAAAFRIRLTGMDSTERAAITSADTLAQYMTIQAE